MAYLWRKLNPTQRRELLSWRIAREHPWHSPPHNPKAGRADYHISAACYNHAPVIGCSLDRMDAFSTQLLEVLHGAGGHVRAWCVLPNHYHALVQTDDLIRLFENIGRFHGTTSHRWNGEENARGRQVFCRMSDRAIRSERHFWATMNYIHNNAVHHRYVKLWTEWPWSSASAFLENVGRKEAEQIWKAYPIKKYGAKWDGQDI
jgi:putative transposase